jgi:hypothetical protein
VPHKPAGSIKKMLLAFPVLQCQLTFTVRCAPGEVFEVSFKSSGFFLHLTHKEMNTWRRHNLSKMYLVNKEQNPVILKQCSFACNVLWQVASSDTTTGPHKKDWNSRHFDFVAFLLVIHNDFDFSKLLYFCSPQYRSLVLGTSSAILAAWKDCTAVLK